jgi:hypothetical protein
LPDEDVRGDVDVGSFGNDALGGPDVEDAGQGCLVSVNER